jgi:hypothetical protein
MDGEMVLYESSPKYCKMKSMLGQGKMEYPYDVLSQLKGSKKMLIIWNYETILYLNFPFKWSKVPLFDLVVAPSSKTPNKNNNKP